MDSPVDACWAVLLGARIFNDVGFYWSHRALHHPPLYRLFHKQHHQFTATIGAAAASFDRKKRLAAKCPHCGPASGDSLDAQVARKQRAEQNGVCGWAAGFAAEHAHPVEQLLSNRTLRAAHANRDYSARRQWRAGARRPPGVCATMIPAVLWLWLCMRESDGQYCMHPHLQICRRSAYASSWAAIRWCYWCGWRCDCSRRTKLREQTTRSWHTDNTIWLRIAFTQICARGGNQV
jgi:hypothetical protein